MKKIFKAILIFLVATIGILIGGFFLASALFYPDKNLPEGKYFIKQMQAALNGQEFRPEEFTNFEWEYVCIYEPYAIRLPTDVFFEGKAIAHVADDGAIKAWDENDVVVFVDKNKKTTLVKLGRTFAAKGGKCYRRGSVTLLKNNGVFSITSTQ